MRWTRTSAFPLYCAGLIATACARTMYSQRYILWKTPDAIVTGAAVAFDNDTNLLFLAKDGNTLFARDGATGRLHWRRSAHVSGCDNLLMRDASIAVGRQALCTDESDGLHAYDKTTGRPLWKRKGGRPIAQGDALFAVSGGLTRLAQDTGSVLWTANPAAPKPAASGSIADIRIVADTVLVQLDKPWAALIAFDAGTGRRLWVKHGWTIAATDSSNNLLFLASSAGRLARIDGRTGSPLWSVKHTVDNWSMGLSTDGAHLYERGYRTILAAWDVKDGSAMQTENVEPWRGDYTVSGDAAYVSDDQDVVRVMNARTGRETVHHWLPNWGYGYPLMDAAGSTTLVAGRAGTVYAIPQGGTVYALTVP